MRIRVQTRYGLYESMEVEEQASFLRVKAHIEGQVAAGKNLILMTSATSFVLIPAALIVESIIEVVGLPEEAVGPVDTGEPDGSAVASN